MGETTGIAWTDSTFNPWIGCQRVSPGCVNCYAEALDRRVGGAIDPADGEKKLRWGAQAPRIRTDTWKNPVKWNRKALAAGRRHRVFCASFADVFEDRPELVPWRRELFELITATPALDWQLLTKRPENVRGMVPWGFDEAATGWPRNLWLGVTVEDQRRAEERIPRLQAIPAAVRFLSCEPLLEGLDLVRWLSSRLIDWIIVGGESGGGARPFDIGWARALRDQADAFGAAFFMKQVGDDPIETLRDPRPVKERDAPYFTRGLDLKAHHGADPKEWPEDLRRQEFPDREGGVKPGLERMRDRTPDGRCPFCLDPLTGRQRRHCGDPECQRAYNRTYQRDRRTGNLVRTQRVGSAAPVGRGHRANAERSKRS